MKKFVSVIALLLAICALVGCGKEEKPNREEIIPSQYGELDDFLRAEKIGVVHRDDFSTAIGGLYYEEDGLYGVISVEGLADSGAIYTLCEPTQQYFAVSQKTISSKYDYENLNSIGLVDGYGNQLVPMEYADFRIIEPHYVVAYKVDLCLGEEEEGHVTSLYIDDERQYYSGEWCVIDLNTGAKVPGLTGKADNTPFADGNYLTYKAEDGYKTVDYNGNPLPEDAKLFDDGSYRIETKIGEVFDTDGNKLFAYDPASFKPYQVEGDYYTATLYMDGVTKSVVMDKTGKIVSTEHEGYIELYGDLIKAEDGVYDFEGNKVYDGKPMSVYYDKMFGAHWIIREDERYTMIDVEGNVYFSEYYNDEYIIYTENFIVGHKTEDGNRMYFSHKDHDYTIEGYSFAPWLIKTEAGNYRYNLVDSMNGNTLLEGYENYTHNSYNDFAYYVYAKYNGGAEVYVIVPDSQFVDVEQKKTDLYNDMAAAFAEEGLNATIDKESGVIALDSGVLFGGDSAELKDEGKAFLDKFIKAYTKIAFSEKYVDFINKTMIEGHTAPVEGSSYALDLPLSEERANNVLQYCLTADTGIDPAVLANSFEAVGYANSQPVYDAQGNVDMAASRRVSFRFLVDVEFE